MKIKKRRKSSRFRGSHTHGRGFKKKARGSGHRGGFGMAGTGKRADQKKTLVLNLYGKDYFGKDRALRRGAIHPKPATINIDSIVRNIYSLINQGKAKESKGIYEINLPDHKILGEGETSIKLKITAHSASASAIEKIKKAGGEIIIRKSITEEAK